MDMRLPPGFRPAAASAEPPQLLLLQRWQPAQPHRSAAAPTPVTLRARLQRLVGR